MLDNTTDTLAVPTDTAPARETDTARRKRLTDTRTCEITTTRDRALAAFRAVAEFQCLDTTRYPLNGVAIEIGTSASVTGTGALQLVATDGHTLARVRVPTLDVANAIVMPDESRLAPVLATEHVTALIRALTFRRKVDGSDRVTLAITFGALRAHGERATSITVTIGDRAPLEFPTLARTWVDKDGNLPEFPPYERVIPSYKPAARVRNSYGGYDGGWPDGERRACVVGFNPHYMARACDAVRLLGREANASSALKMELGAHDQEPVLLTWSDRDGNELLVVIMPMRL